MTKLGKHLTVTFGVGALLLPTSVAASTSAAATASESSAIATSESSEAATSESSESATSEAAVEQNSTEAAGPGNDNSVRQLVVDDPFLEPAPESHATLYTGFLGVDSGFTDRFVVGSFVDLYPGDTGFHADLVYVNREENGAYGAFGLSRRIAGFGRLKLMVGTSTGSQNILPDLSLHAGMEFKPARGLIARPSVTYRHFRHGGSHVEPSVQLAYYFGGGGGTGGYFVAQTDGGLTFTNGGETGWSLSGGLTSVRSNGLRLGFAARAGYMAYDTFLGGEVRSHFWGGGPNIGYRFLSGHELFVRGEFTRNEHFSVTGALIGFKTPL